MIAEDLLVTEEIKNCLKLFEPNMHVEEIILFDTRTKTDKRYYVLHIKESVNRDCDGWIDICLKNYDCEKYYSYLCSTRTRQASQRCSNVRVVF